MDWLNTAWGHFGQTFFVQYFVQPVYLAMTLVIVAIVWRLRAPGESFWRFATPKELYLHPSTRTDIKIALFNLLVFSSGLIAALWFTPQVTVWALEAMGGETARETTLLRGLLAAALLFLTQDFCRYLNHYLHHGSRFLWPFHAVHHSAEVMTPITFLRAHPVYTALQALMISGLVGLAQAIVLVLLVGQIEAWVIFAGSWAFNAYVFFGAHLRHSHIWISYGRTLEHILISPAQHQIHHSSAPEHHDKNFGEVFAIWDWMFGTLYVPDGPEALTFGIGEADGTRIEQPHTGLRAAMLGPFAEVWEEIAKGTSFDPAREDSTP